TVGLSNPKVLTDRRTRKMPSKNSSSLDFFVLYGRDLHPSLLFASIRAPIVRKKNKHIILVNITSLHSQWTNGVQWKSDGVSARRNMRDCVQICHE
ncbi:hypothetical protein PENTCL1PPCAC_23738, partial [Pristionchus entomophagus]